VALSSPALAHPVGGKYLAHQLTLSVSREQVSVEFAVEAPLAVLVQHPMPPDADFDEVILAEVRSGIVVTLDGSTLPMSPVPVEPAAFTPPDGGAARVYRVSLESSRMSLTGAHEVRVSNGNFPDSASFFSNRGIVRGDVDVLETSVIAHDQRTGRVSDTSERYQLGDRHRTLQVVFDARTDPLAASFHALTRARHSRRDLGAAWNAPYPIALASRRLTPETLVTWWLCALAGGATIGGIVSGSPAPRGRLIFAIIASGGAAMGIITTAPSTLPFITAFGAMACTLGAWRSPWLAVIGASVIAGGLTLAVTHPLAISGSALCLLAGASVGHFISSVTGARSWIPALAVLASGSILIHFVAG